MTDRASRHVLSTYVPHPSPGHAVPPHHRTPASPEKETKPLGHGHVPRCDTLCRPKDDRFQQSAWRAAPAVVTGGGWWGGGGGAAHRSERRRPGGRRPALVAPVVTVEITLRLPTKHAWINVRHVRTYCKCLNTYECSCSSSLRPKLGCMQYFFRYIFGKVGHILDVYYDSYSSTFRVLSARFPHCHRIGGKPVLRPCRGGGTHVVWRGGGQHVG